MATSLTPAMALSLMPVRLLVAVLLLFNYLLTFITITYYCIIFSYQYFINFAYNYIVNNFTCQSIYL